MKQISLILKAAIEKENDDYRMFNLLSSKIEDPALKDIVEELAQEELEHRDLLKTLLSMNLNYFDESALTQIEKLPFMQKNHASPSISPKIILTSALKRASDAAIFFKALENASKHEEIKRLLNKIANLELALKFRLENLLNSYP